MKEMSGFTRIALRKRDGTLFVMNDPTVFQSSENAYACFGELKFEDQNQRMQQMEAKRFQDEQVAKAMQNAKNPAVASEEKKAAASNEA